MPYAATEGALTALAAQLRAQGTLVSEHVIDSTSAPALGALVAAGPASTADPAGYAEVIEAVREGYLLHYGTPRLLSGLDRDLELLAGDYLYALGLERLALIGDQGAVGELSDLISLSAQIHADGAGDIGLAEALWTASAVAIATGSRGAFSRLKQAVRNREPGAGLALEEFARSNAAAAGLSEALHELARSIQSSG